VDAFECSSRSVSAVHASIYSVSKDKWEIQDKSSSGTLVNSTLLLGSCIVIRDGDSFHLGSARNGVYSVTTICFRHVHVGSLDLYHSSLHAMYVCMCVCIILCSMCMHVLCMQVCIYACIYVCMYVCMYVCIMMQVCMCECMTFCKSICMHL